MMTMNYFALRLLIGSAAAACAALLIGCGKLVKRFA